VRFDMDQEKGAQTRQGFVDQMANQDILVLGSHFAEPTAGHIVSDDDGCRFTPKQ